MAKFKTQNLSDINDESLKFKSKNFNAKSLMGKVSSWHTKLSLTYYQLAPAS